MQTEEVRLDGALTLQEPCRAPSGLQECYLRCGRCPLEIGDDYSEARAGLPLSVWRQARRQSAQDYVSQVVAESAARYRTGDRDRTQGTSAGSDVRQDLCASASRPLSSAVQLELGVQAPGAPEQAAEEEEPVGRWLDQPQVDSAPHLEPF